MLRVVDTHTAGKLWLVVAADGTMYRLAGGQPLDPGTGAGVPAGRLIRGDCTPEAGSTTTCVGLTGLVLQSLSAPIKSVNVSISLLVVALSMAETADCSMSQPGVDPAYVTSRFWTSRGGALGGYARQLEACSYGAMTISRTAFTVLTVTLPCSAALLTCDQTAIANEASVIAKQRLGAAAFSRFSHTMFVLPVGVASDWGGLAVQRGTQTWLVAGAWGLDKMGTVLQELLHNFGIHHGWRDGYEYADSSTVMGFGSDCCVSAPELWRLGWASPLLNVSRASLMEGVPRVNVSLPATYLGPRGAYVKITPNWMGGAYKTNVYLSLRGRGGGDWGLSEEFVGRLSVHEALAAVDNDFLATADPRYDLIAVLDPGRRLHLPQHRLLIQTQELLGNGSHLLVDLCRYPTSPTDCPMPPLRTQCPNLPGYTWVRDVERVPVDDAETYSVIRSDLPSLLYACEADSRFKGFSWQASGGASLGGEPQGSCRVRTEANRNLTGSCLYTRIPVRRPPAPAGTPEATIEAPVRPLVMVLQVAPECGGMATASTYASTLTSLFWGQRGVASQLSACSYGKMSIDPGGFKVLSPVIIPCSNTSTFASSSPCDPTMAHTARILANRTGWAVLGDFNMANAKANLTNITYPTLPNDDSSLMGGADACPTGPELYRLGWATPLAVLNDTSLPEGLPVTNLTLPATALGPEGALLQVLPTWLGEQYTKQGGDSRLLERYAHVLHLQESVRPELSTVTPEFALVNLLGQGRSLDLPAFRIVIQARALTDNGRRMVVDLCRYRTSAALECRLPPIPTLCARAVPARGGFHMAPGR
ncbi:hypothetical protein HYH03_000019 [Edaphochlamys debaryana]|uniref:Peptidase M11 gametolysin domain-containing protein n=1 Tax=Edaphochlamys debaryana TaxID=47281 RepID=A0A835YEP7_9CHLO|nr:hypothetical protein HYH03_000019 [Edaphochlamys debaryana]|eukprot:KAG2501512.1 hypothetical protein HYH03_000019 [Edaphochlamys debaryana]